MPEKQQQKAVRRKKKQGNFFFCIMLEEEGSCFDFQCSACSCLLLLVEQGPPPQNVSGMMCVIADSWGLPPCCTGSGGGDARMGLGAQAHVALGLHDLGASL